MAGAVHKTCSSEMLGGHGADFLRGVASGTQGKAENKLLDRNLLGGIHAPVSQASLRPLLNAISMAHELHEGGGTSGLAAT